MKQGGGMSISPKSSLPSSLANYWTVDSKMVHEFFQKNCVQNIRLSEELYFELHPASAKDTAGFLVGYFLTSNLVMEAKPNVDSNTWECSFWMLDGCEDMDIRNLTLRILRLTEPPIAVRTVNGPDDKSQLRMSLTEILEEIPDFPKVSEEDKRAETTYFTLVREANLVHENFRMELIMEQYPEIILDVFNEPAGVITGQFSVKEKFVYSFKNGACLNIYIEEKLAKSASLVIGKVGGNLTSFGPGFEPTREELAELFFMLFARLEDA